MGRMARPWDGSVWAWRVALSAGLVVCTAGQDAEAGNTVHPRTPVQWPETSCIQTVDRSVDPRFEFDYAIPNEDLAVTSDELEDSRSHQFVAFCRHWDRESGLPNYVSERDRQRAIEAGLDAADAVVDVLEADANWQASCWFRVTADDARRPISFESADEPVVWDTRDAAPGVYRIAGYTWEPALNLWSAAPWAVRIVDDPEHDVGPAAVVGTLPVGVAHDESLLVDVCIDAPVGSQVELSWGLKEPSPKFEPLATLEYGGGPLELEFVPPELSWGQSVLLAVTVEDPAGLTYTAHGPRELVVFADPESTPEGGSTGGVEDTADGEGSESGDSSSGDGPIEATDASSPSGCAAARASGSRHGDLGVLVFLGLVAGTRLRPTHKAPPTHRTSRS